MYHVYVVYVIRVAANMQNCLNLLDAKYFDYKPTVNKTAIKSDIESGVIVEGATIIEKQNLQVK